ncbi:hypothetical protein N9L91_04315 [Pseudomonadales bacterium]|nr:hypothetical protein [Pseudomonadales bacterium]
MIKLLSVLLVVIVLNPATLYAAPKFTKLTFEELKSLDTSALNEKEFKKYEKAIKKQKNKRKKIIAKAQKKHIRDEEKRIKILEKSLELKVYKKTQVSKSEFDPVPVASGPREYIKGAFNEGFIGYGGLSYFFRSIGENIIQIYVIETYAGEWQRWNKARLPGGTEAEFNSISRDVLNCEDSLCKYEEHFGISLSKNFLSNWYKEGGDIRFQVRGTTTGSEMVLTIPESYTYGFVDKVNSEFQLINQDMVAARRSKIESELEVKPFIIDESLFNTP